MPERKTFRQINQSLGHIPSFGPIPAGQLLPIGISVSVSYLIFEMLLGWGFTWVALFALWGASSWWILTGDKNWKLINKFIAAPPWYCKFRSYVRLTGSTHVNQTRRRKTRI